MYRFQRWLADRLFQVVFWLADRREQQPRPPAWHAEQDRLRDEATARWRAAQR